jgi:hypothetical protein
VVTGNNLQDQYSLSTRNGYVVPGLLDAIKTVAIISMIASFAGILYSAKNLIELMDNILPEKNGYI